MKLLLLYLDPGSGSYLVQAIIAAVLGGLFYIKSFWRKIRALFSRDRKNQENENENA
jgi:hypothetical protein